MSLCRKCEPGLSKVCRRYASLKLKNDDREQLFLNQSDFLAGELADSNGLIGIPVSYDMAWQRRNGGHNSNTGHGQ